MVLSHRKWGSWPSVWGILLLLLLAGWGLFLAADIEADPPLGASDLEGQILLGARARLAGQDIPLGHWAPGVLVPFQTRIHAWAFDLFGVDLATARSTVLAAGLLALLLLYLLIRRASGPLIAFLTVLVLAINPVFLGVARTALPSVFSILFMLAVIWLWIGGARRGWLAYLAGLGLVGAGLAENGPTNLFFLLAGLLMAVMLRLHAWKMAWFTDTRRRLRFFWAGVVTGLVPFFVSVLTHWEEYGIMWRHFASFSLRTVAANLLRSPVAVGDLMQRMPLVVALALVYFLFFAKDVIRPVARHRRLDEIRLWFLCWLLTGIPLFVLGFQTSLHDLVILVPPACVVAVEGVARLFALRRFERPNLDVMIVMILLAGVTWFTSAWFVRYLMTNTDLPELVDPHRLRAALAGTVLLWGVTTYLAGWLYLKWRRMSLIPLQHLPVRGMAAILFLGMIGAGAANAGMWWTHRTHEVREATETLARVLPGDALVVGSWAPLLTLGHDAGATLIWPHVNSEPAPWHARVTHLLLQDGRESDPAHLPRRMFTADPEHPAPPREDQVLRIRNQSIRLYPVNGEG